MLLVETRCPACTTLVRLPPAALIITVAPRTGVAGKVAFTCPVCDRQVSRKVDAFLAARLRAQGVGATAETRAHLDHPSNTPYRPDRRPDGPPFTPDDVLDLHLLLERDDWFQDLLAVAD